MIIVYGGTFNPPTIAHQLIASKVIEDFKPEKFILLPVGENYPWKSFYVPFKKRFEMLKLAFKDEIYEVSTLENKKVYKGTYYTLKRIEKTYKNSVYFLLGADNLSYLEKWINYELLIKEFRFIVIKRKGFNLDEIMKKYHPYEENFNVIEMDLDISSSLFREEPEKNKHFIPNDVLKYVKEHKLYEV